jgi:intracellular sulfur oxidation DsrE/DsrF family protein
MTPTPQPSTLIVINNDGMGQADRPLCHMLIRNYLRLLAENDMLPGAIAFYTEGVRLVIDGSPVLDDLRALEQKGVHLLICKTCIDYYQVADQVRVGIVGGMGDIMAAQWKAEKVITL